MADAAHFAAVFAVGWFAAAVLTQARWTWQSPRTGILCWQALGLAVGLSAVGAPLALALQPRDGGLAPALLRCAAELSRGRLPHGVGPARLLLLFAGVAVAATLIGTTVACLVGAVRHRRRHRALLGLVGRPDPAAPGALVVDHPGAAAYCLPGVRHQVVVSAGALRLLDGGQLAAVVSHERAHAAERHDLVLLPFAALCRAFPAVRAVRAAHDSVALLVEMCADDRARRLHADGPLVGALQRFAATSARVDRLLHPQPPPTVLRRVAALAAAQGLAAVPVLLFLA